MTTRCKKLSERSTRENYIQKWKRKRPLHFQAYWRYSQICGRCNRKSNISYPRYGGRGIKVKISREDFISWFVSSAKKRGFKQEEIKSFSQSSVSKLESRKDMKISNLIEYLDNLGLGIEIKAYPKDKNKKNEDIVLLKA